MTLLLQAFAPSLSSKDYGFSQCYIDSQGQIQHRRNARLVCRLSPLSQTEHGCRRGLVEAINATARVADMIAREHF